jgi:hypothetical protein
MNFIVLILLQGCTLLYDVSKDVDLETISVTTSSAKTGRATVWIEDTNRANIDSIYSNSNDIYTIQKVDKGKLFSLHGITKDIEEFHEDKSNLINKYGLKKLSLSKKNSRSSDVLVDSQKLYLTVSKKNDDFIYEYTNDMEVAGVKRILLVRKKAEEERLLVKKKAEKKRQQEVERKQLAKQKAEERKIVAKQEAEKRKILAQEERAKKLQKVKLLKRSIGRRVSWYGSHKVDTDDCVQLYMFRKCMWVTYKYKFQGVLKSVDESSYTIEVTGVQLSIPSMVSMKYKQFQQQGVAWGEGQQGSMIKVSINRDVNVL